MFKLYVATFLMLLSPVLLLAQSNQTKKNVGKIIFATQPFSNSNVSPTKSFTSSDFIYGQLVSNSSFFYEFLNEGNGTMADKSKTYPSWYLYYVVKVYQKKEQMGSSNNEVTCSFSNVNWNTKTLNIDVLPDPKNGTSKIVSQYKNNIPETVPLYTLIDAVHFPASGNYTIKIEVYDEAFDAWGNKTSKGNWPSFEGEFDFTFNTSDIATLKSNKEKLNNDYRAAYYAKQKAVEDATLEKFSNEYSEKQAVIAKQEKERQKKEHDEYIENLKAAIEAKDMPSSWTAKSATTAAGFTIAQIKKEFIEHSNENAKIIKVYIEPGGSWLVSKNTFGIPTGQYINTEVLVFYRVKDECMVRNMYIEKNYLGGGRYGAPSIQTGANDMKLPCSKMR
jgi:hypothetical protein